MILKTPVLWLLAEFIHMFVSFCASENLKLCNSKTLKLIDDSNRCLAQFSKLHAGLFCI
jgi:hypothetical protein